MTFRDVRYIITFAMQLWLFASPVLYSIEMIPARWRLLYEINPMAVLVTGFRACVVQVERRFADVI